MLDGNALKAKMSERIFEGLKRVYTKVDATANYSSVVEAQWRSMADAISDIALDIVADIQQNAQVNPGISVVTSGGPSTQSGSTITPGTIS